MIPGLIGKKIGMTQIFDDHGIVTPVTVIKAGPCYVTQVKTPEKDRYSAVQLGFETVKESRKNKPELGHLKKAGEQILRILSEFRIDPDEASSFELGQPVDVDIFNPGDFVDIVGTSKGRGFTGVIKRHHFSRSPMTHGTHECFRHGGSIGGRYPQHTIKGRRMAGQHGNRQVTMQNHSIVGVQKDQSLLLVKGAVPGHRNAYLIVRRAKKKKTEPINN